MFLGIFTQPIFTCGIFYVVFSNNAISVKDYVWNKTIFAEYRLTDYGDIVKINEGSHGLTLNNYENVMYMIGRFLKNVLYSFLLLAILGPIILAIKIVKVVKYLFNSN